MPHLQRSAAPPPRPIDTALDERAEAALRDGCAALGLELSAAQRATAIAYAQLLHRWRRVYNLVGARQLTDIVSQHLVDSLAALPHVRGRRILDIGSGAGLPGVPLAIALPRASVVLLDANAKRTRFLTQAVHALGLANAEVVRERAENYNAAAGFDTVVARALASLPELVRLASPLLAEGGEILALKGRLPATEINLGDRGYRIDAIHTLHPPGVAGPRSLVRVVRGPSPG